jgi:hypothetical protein
MPYLSQRALEGLKAYEYKPAGYTYLDKIHAPFYNCEITAVDCSVCDEREQSVCVVVFAALRFCRRCACDTAAARRRPIAFMFSSFLTKATRYTHNINDTKRVRRAVPAVARAQPHHADRHARPRPGLLRQRVVLARLSRCARARRCCGLVLVRDWCHHL